MKAIINTKLITENGMIWDGAVTFDHGRIISCGWREDVEIPEGTELIDAGGLYTAPGLIDIHNHGGPDFLYHEDPVRCSEFFLKHGETTVLPTFYCNLTLEQMLEGLEKVKAASKQGAGRNIGGIYMEGPYMNGSGSNQKYILWGGDIDEKEYAPLVAAMKGFARVWAIDPARPGIVDFMKYVRREDPNAIFSNGHSNATFAQCRAVRKYGVRLQTHFNDSGQARGFAQGTAGSGCDHYSLHEPDLYAELICDEVGVHVDGDLIKTLVRTKGVERVILITDHMADKDHFRNNEAEGIAYGPDLNYDYEGHLAGSHLTLENACRNLMKHTAYGLCHAIRMATLNPAQLLGIDDEVGSLEPGKRANIILIDDMVNVKSVFLDGELAVQDGELVK